MRQLSAVLALLALLLVAAVSPAAAKVKAGPAGNAFYTPPSPLPGKAHGDAIWARKLSGEAALKSAGSNWLVLYRSTGSDGKPIGAFGPMSGPKGDGAKK